MKKKLIIGLSMLSLIFFLGGIYITFIIERASSTLDDLITLHQVDILREHLLVELKGAQSDLSLHNTRHAKGVDSLVSHVRNMERIISTCYDCHHTAKTNQVFDDLAHDVEGYKDALSRVFTIRSNQARLIESEDRAFEIGEGLSDRVKQITSLARISLDRKTASTIEEIKLTKKILFILVAGGTLFSLVLAIRMIRVFTGPMNTLLEATGKIKEGDLDHRVLGLKDEFGELASSFNEMAGSLKDQMQKMQRTEQMVVCGEMTTRLAHEIKNPLAGIKLSMEVLSDESVLSDDDKEVLRRVVEEVNRIEQMIKSLLNFARPAEPQFMSTSVSDVLEKTLSFFQRYSLRSLERSTRIRIVREIGKSIPEVMADPLQLQQIFLNLFINAADAMPHGGELHVRAYHDSLFKSVKVEISDTGKGIDEENRAKLFQPFFTTKPKGTGLGLTIIQQIVEQHHGVISVSNKPEGGALFKISFPIETSIEEMPSR